jgi:hypothetical protein
MRHPFQVATVLAFAIALAAPAATAAEKHDRSAVQRSATGRRLEPGEAEAIRYQRAKDRADAAQARKEARNPEHFTYAAPQNNPPDSLATRQREEALEKSGTTNNQTGSADRMTRERTRRK